MPSPPAHLEHNYCRPPTTVPLSSVFSPYASTPVHTAPPSPQSPAPPSPQGAAPSALVHMAGSSMKNYLVEIARLTLTGGYDDTVIHCSNGSITAPRWLLVLAYTDLSGALKDREEQEYLHVHTPDTSTGELATRLKERLYHGLVQEVSRCYDMW